MKEEKGIPVYVQETDENGKKHWKLSQVLGGEEKKKPFKAKIIKENKNERK